MASSEFVPASVDPCSSARRDAVCTHFSLDLTIDFGEKRIFGSTILTILIQGDDVREVHLDGKELSIQTVSLEDTGASMNFVEKETALGTDIVIYFSQAMDSGTTTKIKIDYSTSPLASGVQWLQPEQTAMKKMPFMFTQCQAIHARSVMPCQDTPALKCTYDARLRVAEGIRALMSALMISESQLAADSTNDRPIVEYAFEQKIAIPTYLLAIVAGNIESRDLSSRCRIWGEPDTVEEAAFEFEEVEKMLSTAEELLGPYVWTRYDMIVLPPSFPYGGMENPMLTFLTPTLLAGDRSLVNVVVHEIVHSWTGNLVTSKTWEDFWLNEGFTVFCERKILEKLSGHADAQLAYLEGLSALKKSVDFFGSDNAYTALCPKFNGSTDPDDVFSSVPYEKGSNFLYYLQSLVGTAEMDDFLKKYVIKFSHKSISTTDFQNYFCEFFTDKAGVLKQVKWNTWYTAPGMPVVSNKWGFVAFIAFVHKYEAEFVVRVGLDGYICSLSCTLFKHDCPPCLILNDGLMRAQQGMHTASQKTFYHHLHQAKICSQIVFFDYILNHSKTTPTHAKFFMKSLCMKTHVVEHIDEVINFLTTQGRMKFVRPLYRAFSKVPGFMQKSVQVFLTNRKRYHNIAGAMIAKDLNIEA
eukprot:gene1862-4959_t